MKKIFDYIKMIPHNHVDWVPFKPKPIPYFTLDVDARDDWYARQHIEHCKKLTLKKPLRAKIDKTIWFLVYSSFMLGIMFLTEYLFEMLYKYYHP